MSLEDSKLPFVSVPGLVTTVQYTTISPSTCHWRSVHYYKSQYLPLEARTTTLILSTYHWRLGLNCLQWFILVDDIWLIFTFLDISHIFSYSWYEYMVS